MLDDTGPSSNPCAGAHVRSGMQMAVSPYHLTTREPPALAAFLLARRVVTLMPAPFEGADRQQVQAATRQVPRYLKFMESWRWTMPLWREGVVGSMLEGEDAVQDVRAVCRRIDADVQLAPLRLYMHPSLFEDERGYLDAVAADLLKGGPDPGVSVPLAAGIDRFAARHALMVGRTEPISVAQRAEVALGRRLFAVGLPILLQAGGERLLEARRLLAPELADLRAALAGIGEAAFEPDPAALVEAQRGAMEAAAAYARAFDEAAPEIAEVQEDGEEEPRMIAGTATLVALHMPTDAVLRSSLAAVRSLGGRPRVRPDGQAAVVSNLPVLAEPDVGPGFVTLVVKAVGGRAGAGRWGAGGGRR
jgi:hypothetical protein